MGSPELRVFVVWIPVLAGDDFDAARRAAATLRDPRIIQYWDPRRALGNELGRVLALPPSKSEAGRQSGLAWDVYLLYPRRVIWGASAPRPPFWMHQLEQLRGGPPPELDPEALRARVEGSLAP